ncbi:hypothetical protein J0S82_015405, partial [Galemys pyrenaicus]
MLRANHGKRIAAKALAEDIFDIVITNALKHGFFSLLSYQRYCSLTELSMDYKCTRFSPYNSETAIHYPDHSLVLSKLIIL